MAIIKVLKFEISYKCCQLKLIDFASMMADEEIANKNVTFSNEAINVNTRK